MEPRQPQQPTGALILLSIHQNPDPPLTVLGGPIDDQYQFKRQRQKILLAASVKALVNTISTPESSTAVQPIDDFISFPPINPARVITPHYDALILTLCINNFDVHKVLVDPGSAIELMHLPAFRQIRVLLSHLNSTSRVLSAFNGATTLTMGDIALSVKAGPVTQQVLFLVVDDLGPYNAIIGQTKLHTMKAVSLRYH